MTADIELLPLPERFDCTNGNTPWCQGCYTMTPNEYGDYVQWEDYERITAAQAAEIERLRRMVQERDNMLGRRPCLGVNADGNPRCFELVDARAEIEALRALLLEACDDGDEADADLLATLERARTAEAKVERLAEALRAVVADMREWGEPAKGAHVERIQRRLDDALRDHDQEVGNE